jgi:hypothetical protein
VIHPIAKKMDARIKSGHDEDGAGNKKASLKPAGRSV